MRSNKNPLYTTASKAPAKRELKKKTEGGEGRVRGHQITARGKCTRMQPLRRSESLSMKADTTRRIKEKEKKLSFPFSTWSSRERQAAT